MLDLNTIIISYDYNTFYPPVPTLLILESLCLLRGWCKRSSVITWTWSSTAMTCSWAVRRRCILERKKRLKKIH